MDQTQTVEATERPFGAFAPRGPVAALLAVTRRVSDTWLGHRLGFLLRRIAIALLNGKPLDVEALGAKMRLFPYNNVCEKRILFMPQFFDLEEREVIAKRLKPGFVFVDIGSNIGGYSLFVAARGGPQVRVLAIEPQPRVFERLAANIRFNGFATVKAFACAIADKDGELKLFVDTANQGESSVKIVSNQGEKGAVTVASRALTSLLREERISRLDALKIDAEGAEDIILDPFFKTAPESLFPQLLIIERGGSRWHIDVIGILAANGYRRIADTRTNILFER